MGDSVESHARGALGAGEDTVDEFGDILVDYGIPLISGIAGFYALPGAVGGINSLFNTVSTVTPTYAGRLAGFALGALFLVVGLALWSMGGERADLWKRVLGRGFGAFFLGGGARYIVSYGIMNQSGAPSGILDTLIASVSTTAGGSAPDAGAPQ